MLPEECKEWWQRHSRCMIKEHAVALCLNGHSGCHPCSILLIFDAYNMQRRPGWHGIELRKHLENSYALNKERLATYMCLTSAQACACRRHGEAHGAQGRAPAAQAAHCPTRRARRWHSCATSMSRACCCAAQDARAQSWARGMQTRMAAGSTPWRVLHGSHTCGRQGEVRLFLTLAVATIANVDVGRGAGCADVVVGGEHALVCTRVSWGGTQV